jgi:FkbM family methyltransferase
MRSLRLTHRLAHFPARVRGSIQQSRLLEGRAAFVVREVLPADRVASYVPCGARAPLTLRHHSADISIVREIFEMRLLEMPSEVQSIVENLGRPPRVLDLGGHIGVYGVFVLSRFPAAEVMSFEPDAGSFALLTRNAAASASWFVCQAAAAASGGWASFQATGSPASALQHDGREHGAQVPTVDVLPMLRKFDVVKIDIEGGEWALFRDPRWANSAPAVMSLEFHPEGCPSADYVAAALEAIATAGMQYRMIPGAPAGAGMLWAWRP